MNERPEPLTPPDCDLRHYDWMPLTITVLKGSRSWMRCKRNPALAFYLINLWTASWHQVPAASLENDEDYLCDVAQCDPKTWEKLRDVIMAGFVECDDGRLYHQYVAREANKAWQLLLAQRARTEAATAARRARQANVTPSSSPPQANVTNDVTNNVTSDVTLNATSPPSEPLRSPPDQTRPDQTNQERYSGTSYRATAAPSPVGPPDVRTEFWTAGLAILRGLTGKSDGVSRAFLGRMLKVLADDCDAGMAILHHAGDLRPGGPEAWIIASCEARMSRKTSGISARKEKILRAAGLWDEHSGPIIDVEREGVLLQ